MASPTVYCCRTVLDYAHSGVSLQKMVGRSLGLYRVSVDGMLFLPLPPCEVGKVYPHLGPASKFGHLTFCRHEEHE